MLVVSALACLVLMIVCSPLPRPSTSRPRQVLWGSRPARCRSPLPMRFRCIMAMVVHEEEGHRPLQPSSSWTASGQGTEAGGPCGYDPRKKTKARKRHPKPSDQVPGYWCRGSGLGCPGASAAGHEPQSSWVELTFFDSRYANDEVQRVAFVAGRVAVILVKRTGRSLKGFVVLPKRWIVERAPAWFNRARGLFHDGLFDNSHQELLKP